MCFDAYKLIDSDTTRRRGTTVRPNCRKEKTNFWSLGNAGLQHSWFHKKFWFMFHCIHVPLPWVCSLNKFLNKRVLWTSRHQRPPICNFYSITINNGTSNGWVNFTDGRENSTSLCTTFNCFVVTYFRKRYETFINAFLAECKTSVQPNALPRYVRGMTSCQRSARSTNTHRWREV